VVITLNVVFNAALAARSYLYPRERQHKVGSEPANTKCGSSVTSYILLGALDIAYDLANQCLDETQTAPGFKDLFIDPGSYAEMRPFRRDPRYQAFATRVGLMAYWQQHGPPDECDLKDGKLTCR
jgi:hypothetical protein